VLTKFIETSYSFAFGVENLTSEPMKYLVDCSTSTNMIYSEKDGKVEKVVKPGEIKFFLHSESSPGAESFTRGC